MERVYAHNTAYDMNMFANVTDDNTPLQVKNWGDTMGLARLTFEAKSTRQTALQTGKRGSGTCVGTSS